jgi:hypothetical protein
LEFWLITLVYVILGLLEVDDVHPRFRRWTKGALRAFFCKEALRQL